MMIIRFTDELPIPNCQSTRQLLERQVQQVGRPRVCGLIPNS